MKLLDRVRRPERTQAGETQPCWRGVIDIGSNSVRLVIYVVHRASLIQHYNEKVMAGLGRGLAETGRLNAAGVEAAIGALKRFRDIAHGMGEVPLDVFATAAVRTAIDGEDFARRARDEAGLSIHILTGVEEARGSAFGVMAGTRDVDGVIGDLGGSSLELIRANGGLGEGETHLLGPFALPNAEVFPADAVRAAAKAALAGSRALKDGGRLFYAVGGSWRAFASLHMEITQYPLHLLQGYRMTAKEVARLARRLADPKDSVHALATGVADKRAVLLPYAAVVLDEVMKAGSLSEMVVSAYGLREGRVLSALKEPNDAGQGLLDGLEAVARLSPRQLEFCQTLQDFLQPVVRTLAPVFGDAGTDDLMVRAAVRLADIGAALHPDYRPNLAYQLVLHGPFAGVSHAERAFLALALAARYMRGFRPPERDAALMSPAQAERARQIGALMRLGAVFSGRTAEVLARASLALEPGFLVLRVDDRSRDMVSEMVLRRLEQAAASLGLQALVG